MKLAVVGTGYVGLVTGTCFAEMGHDVTCIDIDGKKIALLNRGLVPFFEPGLSEKVGRNIGAKRLHFTTSYAEGIAGSEVVFIAVPTPEGEEGACDVHYVEEATRSVAEVMDHRLIVVSKSTVPIGTTLEMKKWLQEELDKRGTDLTFSVCSNPEFLKQGNAVSDFMKPDRVVLGVEDDKTGEKMRELYSSFTLSHDRILTYDIASAEMTKYAANAMLATRISFMNELSHLCEKLGADIGHVRQGMGADSRIGYSFLYAGIGYGGSCFPKDIRALRWTAKEEGLYTDLLDAADRVNERQKLVLGQKIEAYFKDKGGLKGKRLAFWGLAFKPETDDMRAAPALALIDYLTTRGATLRLYDPVAMKRAKVLFGDDPHLTFCKNELDAANAVDGIVLVTEWKQFRVLPFDQILQAMKGCAFFDGRNQYSPTEMAEKGFDYISIGRAKTLASQAHATVR